MDKVTTIKSEDRRKIDKVIFTFPNLMNKEAEGKIREEYQDLLNAEDALQRAREEVRRLEQIKNEKQAAFNSKSSLFTLEFATVEKEHITHEASFSIRGMGNDIIGKQY